MSELPSSLSEVQVQCLFVEPHWSQELASDKMLLKFVKCIFYCRQEKYSNIYRNKM